MKPDYRLRDIDAPPPPKPGNPMADGECSCGHNRASHYRCASDPVLNNFAGCLALACDCERYANAPR